MKEQSALKEVADVNDPDSPSQIQIIIVQGSELMFSHQVTGKRKNKKRCVCVYVCLYFHLLDWDFSIYTLFLQTEDYCF